MPKTGINNAENNSDIKIVMGRITYINMDPVYYGLKNDQYPKWIKMVDDVPAVLNRMLSRCEIDISPVSAVAYARHADQWMVLPNLSIASRGKVMSVLLVSKCPIDRLNDQKVILTNESATSVDLLRLIFKLKGIHPHLERGKVNSPGDLPADAQAALVIGDTALRKSWRGTYEYVFDLGQLWQDMTGLPFVFALWAVRRAIVERHPEIVASIVQLFKQSKEKGNAHRSEIITAASQKLGLDRMICRKYYEHLICDLGPAEIKGAETFFKLLFENKILDHPVQLSFFAC